MVASGKEGQPGGSRTKGGGVVTAFDNIETCRAQLARVSLFAGAWGLGYALYRGYYALGGTAGLPGTLAQPGLFRFINVAATVILLAAAVLPVALLPLWSRRAARPVLLGLCWAVAVGCVMHALIDEAQRVLSLAGLLRIDYPASVWASVDRRAADVQDMVFNEPWFLLEGLAWGALGWLGLGPGRARRWWVASALVAVAILTAVGLLSATGVIGKVVIG